MVRCKIKDIVTLSTETLIPQKGTAYHLYSLPSFDEGKQREEIMGEDILSCKFIVPDKCILFNKLNVRFKRVWRIDNTDNNKLASTEFLPLIVNEEKVDFQYCYYLLISDCITNYLSGQNANTSGSHKRISPDIFFDITITLPEMAEQKRIGRFLSMIDKKIEVNSLINRNLENLSKLLYDYWFVQFDFPDENEKPYKSSGGKMVWNETLKRDIPDGWEVKKIGDIISNVPTSYKLQTKEYQDRGKYPIIDQTRDKYIIGYSDMDDAVLQLYPVVVFGDHSCSVKYVNFPFCRGADGTQIMNPSDKRVSPEYLYFATKSVRFNAGYARHFSFLKDSIILLPKDNIAEKYQIQVKVLFDKIKVNITESYQLNRQRDELLPLLMTGQVKLK